MQCSTGNLITDQNYRFRFVNVCHGFLPHEYYPLSILLPINKVLSDRNSMYHNRIAIFESLQSGKYMILIPTGPAFPINISVSSCICSYTLRTDPLASGQRKRSLPSDEKVETLPKRPKNDVTLQGMHDLYYRSIYNYYRSPINFIILSSILTCIKTLHNQCTQCLLPLFHNDNRTLTTAQFHLP